ncbi:Gp49 family protein [Moorena sp. SIO3A2]|uniref:Gp49 family protein n=1 Tax=Moorena sp. SIO3A2 TaxID=2607841 RepID=UPI0013B6374D|nr:Gp49 family protein [Moorena sp. SIO3A2]NER90341.1 hypothetical protein [Moorena sp. SIO3A2]
MNNTTMAGITPDHVQDIFDRSALTYEIYGVPPKIVVAVCQLPNGFIITGQGACVDTTAFNEEAGKRVANNQLLDKIWELEGYLLQQHLFDIGRADDFVD